MAVPLRRVVRPEDHTTALKLPGKRSRTCPGSATRDTHAELADAVKASGTCLTGIYRIGPVIAGWMK